MFVRNAVYRILAGDNTGKGMIKAGYFVPAAGGGSSNAAG